MLLPSALMVSGEVVNPEPQTRSIPNLEFSAAHQLLEKGPNKNEQTTERYLELPKSYFLYGPYTLY